MSLLTELVMALRSAVITVIDLTAPLSENTPVIELPAGLGQAWPLKRELISRFDSAGPHTYWNNLRISEHTGTHFDAPVHWLSGKNLDDVSQVPASRLIGPAAVLDFTAEVTADPDFLLQVHHVQEWQERNGPLPTGGWLLYRTGWADRQGDRAAFLNDRHTPGIAPQCARWLAEETAVVGVGVETVGTDAGLADSFAEQPFPCHWYFQGANKYGLTQLRNLDLLPPQGTVLIAAPLPIVGGSGSPTRVLALVEQGS
ncbi:MAG TPA: cyclase family protein [Streptosporangiaceae bacterium]|nr:cyclase family protein [Streptosporangiaceae bacterium]